ncbi:hypothetical protein DDB_G0272877 [Dictyostelium discoideum AX4]|uniref:Uncharacterized protein n=1 Tax=Dictyostelium discoideum TaxID=44689 RepID=Q556H9_DICDI|nr:hypothetical protein DDB_G0274049 [Dictyostelium discoideum AX4]XP_645030.1 hypothetical protein DDB_G0272877 [Dictyostelium discoideum AX4]EAL70458.1 hypothetical protein DDB_G0274049 [Dictyostelium discoideum AX4]EAL71076.1 hypothetical protein DDB_G0272877 [Dictyostelium discoideum AX4]|eukprot:XP_644383.1 hypothetical protein DDB_G0274049 [Dictyostelium discoideum AX4]
MSKQILPIDYITVDVKLFEDIPKAVQSSPKVTVAVENNLKLYASISVSDAMQSLATVGELLKVANAAANGHSCSKPIIKILAEYQSLVNDTVSTCSLFVFNCIASLKQHELALRLAEKQPLKALSIMSKTAEKAKEMADKSQQLVNMSKILVDQSTEALEMATGDKNDEIVKENEVIKKQGELEAQAAKLRTEVEDLKRQADEFKQLADKASKEAAEQRKSAMLLQVVSAVTTPIVQLAGPIISSVSGAGVIDSTSKILGVVGNAIDGESTATKKQDETEKPTTTKTESVSASSEIKDRKIKLEKQEEEKSKELKEKKAELKKVESEPESDSKKEKKEKLEKSIKEIDQQLEKLGKLLSDTINEIANQYKERAAKSEDKEASYMKLKSQYQDLQRKSNADLAQNVVQLKNLSIQKNSLEVSIKSLEITIKTMGKVRTIFENTRLFWLQVKGQCEALSDVSNMKDLADAADIDDEFKVDFTNEIKSSGLNWLALAQINFTASNTIIGIKKNFDEVMNNLPGRSEAEAIVKASCDEIQKILTQENKKIDEIKSQTDKLVK